MVRAAFSKIRALGPPQLANGSFAILFVADLRVGMGCGFRHRHSVFAVETQPIADCSGHKKGPGVGKPGPSYKRRNVLAPQKQGPAPQKSFRLFTAYLREYLAKTLKSAGWLFAMSTGSCS